MQKDFNPKRSNKGSNPKTVNKTKPRLSIGTTNIGWSFLLGLVIGILLGASAVSFYAGIFNLGVTPNTTEKQNDVSPKPTVVFTFPKQLRESKVVVNPSVYQPLKPLVPLEYVLQVASFTNPKRAEKLRANLILDSFQASTFLTRSSEEVSYRVVVGPFAKKVEAERKRTALRALGFEPILASNPIERVETLN